jgi:hypothetical protein
MSEAALSANSQNNQIQQQMFKDCNCKQSSTNEMADQLFQQYGVQNVLQAVTNAAVDFVKKELSAMIENMGMPQFMKDDAMKQIESIGNSFLADTPQGAQEGVDQVLGKSGRDDQSGSGSSGGGASSGSAGGGSSRAGNEMSGMMDMLRQSMQDETEGASKSSSGSGGGGTGNWLAVLARAMGQTAGKHLKAMTDLGNKLGGIDSKENPEEFAKIQAEFQAEAQIFKMFQEAIGTMIKSIGEGMASVARKQ